MKLGFAKKDITPDFPVPMAGYNKPGRISQGVHDKLYARALFFEDGPIVLLQLDILNVDRICLNALYQALQEEKKASAGFPAIEKKHILVCATHTHSGFGGIFDLDKGINREVIPLLGETNPDLVALIVKKSVEAITEAIKNCTETTVRMNTGTINGLGANRRRADIPCDNSLFIMEFSRHDQKKILLYNLCCHPTVMNGENRLLSADFPGAAAEKLEGVPGGYDMVIFINGSAGDMSTRFTRRESSFEECSRYANLIIEAINSLKKGEFLPLEKIELHYHNILLYMAEIPELNIAADYLEKAEKNLAEIKNGNADRSAIRKAESIVEGAYINYMKSRYAKSRKKNSSRTIETGILTINATTIVCSPFELFSSLALILKEKKNVGCFGYINCLEDYLSDCDAWDSQEYEALSSDFLRGEGERYIELVSALV